MWPGCLRYGAPRSPRGGRNTVWRRRAPEPLPLFGRDQRRTRPRNPCSRGDLGALEEARRALEEPQSPHTTLALGRASRAGCAAVGPRCRADATPRAACITYIQGMRQGPASRWRRSLYRVVVSCASRRRCSTASTLPRSSASCAAGSAPGSHSQKLTTARPRPRLRTCRCFMTVAPSGRLEPCAPRASGAVRGRRSARCTGRGDAAPRARGALLGWAGLGGAYEGKVHGPVELDGDGEIREEAVE